VRPERNATKGERKALGAIPGDVPPSVVPGAVPLPAVPVDHRCVMLLVAKVARRRLDPRNGDEAGGLSLTDTTLVAPHVNQRKSA